MGCGASSNTNQAAPNVRSTVPASSNNNRRNNNTNMSNPPMASQPVTIPRPFRHGSPITQGDLNNMRTEFWTSRTDGNSQIWQTLHSACNALVEDDVALTNAILEATGLITPNGSLEIVYDERGHQYKLPSYVYAKPIELTSPNISTNNNNDTGASSNSNNGEREKNNNSSNNKNSNSNSNNGTHGSSSGSSNGGGSGNNVQSPPAPASGGAPLRLRIRVNPGDYNLTVNLDSNSSILHLKHYLCDHAGSEHSALANITVPRQRIIYMGKQLPDTLKLGEAKFDETKVVQVFLKPVASTN